MSNLKILRGVPASGKTTAALQLVEEGWTRVNRDDIRFALFSSYWGKGVDENVVTDVENATITSALRAGHDVVVDATNLAYKPLRTKLSLASEFGATVSFEDFPINLETAVARDEYRAEQGERSVGEKVIADFFKRYKINPESGVLPPAPEPWPVFEKAAAYNPELPDAYIVDTDGTVADSEGVRNPHDTSKYKLDKPLYQTIVATQAIHYKGFSILGVSGRDEAYRSITLDWWKMYNIPHDKFFMRAAGDKRVDAIVKYEIFKRDIEPYYNVLGAFDDRPQVLRMWRAIGIPTFDVGKGVDF